ncbi:MAG: 2'-deoxycytidine 5'-triphosphate deaminase [Candidatus Halichondribacter symbioticus]
MAQTDKTTAKKGVLPSQAIRAMVAAESIRASRKITDDQIQPASLDLRLGATAYRVRASFLAGSDNKVADRLPRFEMHAVDLTQGAVLEKGCVYLVPLLENLRLPKNISAVTNAKSSTGRVDLFTRCITDYGVEFDRITAGYDGPLYGEICPRSFSILVREGMRLNQIRFHQGQSILSDAELTALHANHPLVDGRAQIDNGLRFSVDLQSGLVGYRAKPHAGLIDLDLINHYKIDDYWEEVQANDGQIILDPGAFYILASQQAVHIPPDFAAEMAPYLAMVGEFRVHYAGFFDPGFGHNAAGGAGSRGVLEVRCHEAPFVLEHGQSVGRLVYERMAEVPDILYGDGKISSNYQGQGLKLSKHFKTG